MILTYLIIDFLSQNYHLIQLRLFYFIMTYPYSNNFSVYHTYSSSYLPEVAN